MLKIYIEDKELDLFKDENIELHSSVANTSDISKVNTDYTFAFTVPASDRNNATFRHYYNADIDNTFDARTAKKARIELDGMPFRSGKVRLSKVAVKNGAPSAYSLNFWGTLFNFKTLIKDDMITKHIDLSHLDHEYNYTNVRNGLTTGLFDADIVYTLISSRRQFMYNSDPGDDTNTDKLVNIAYNGEDRGVVWNELKPSVRLLAIIEAIEAHYGFTFSRDFFGRNEFKELYMWLNNDEGTQYTPQLINWTSGNATEFGLNLATDTWELEEYPDGFTNIKYRIEVTPGAGFNSVPYRIIARDGNQELMSVEATGHFTTDFISAIEPPFNIQFFVAASASFEYEADMLMRGYFFAGTLDRAAFGADSAIQDIFNVGPALPDLKVMEFLKALFNMFKLVVIPDDNNNVYVNTIDDYYLAGDLLDISKHVDWSNYDVERGNILNLIDFKYNDPITILNTEFENQYGEAYGDESLRLVDADGEQLDGDQLEIAIPFEIMLFERLRDQNTNNYVPIQYGLATDDKIDPVQPKGVIHYNNRVSVMPQPISLLNQAGDTVQINGIINSPAHTLGYDDPQFSILWGEENNTWNGARITGTLYSNYWQKYIESIFNIKRRNFKFSAVLPAWLLTRIKLNDILFIKDRYYRIDNFTVNLTTRRTTLALMNTFENNFGLFLPSQTSVMLSALEQLYGVYVTNGAVLNITKQDTGDGTAWADVYQEGYNIQIFVTANSGATRMMYLNVDNGAGKSFQILLTQEAP